MRRLLKRWPGEESNDQENQGPATTMIRVVLDAVVSVSAVLKPSSIRAE